MDMIGVSFKIKCSIDLLGLASRLIVQSRRRKKHPFRPALTSTHARGSWFNLKIRALRPRTARS